MSGDLKSPSTSIPVGTLWAILTTFVSYLVVILSLAASTSHGSLLRDKDVIQDVSLYPPTILAGEVAVTFFSALMGVVGAAKLMQALARDKLFPGFSLFGKGLRKSDEPVAAILLTYLIAQLALFADLDQLASLISIFYMVCKHTLKSVTIPSFGLSTEPEAGHVFLPTAVTSRFKITAIFQQAAVHQSRRHLSNMPNRLLGSEVTKFVYECGVV